VAGKDWAVTGTGIGTFNVTTLGSYQATYGSGDNTDVTTASPGTVASNSLRFNGASATLTLPGGTSTIGSGGILMSSVASGAMTINSGTLQGASGGRTWS